MLAPNLSSGTISIQSNCGQSFSTRIESYCKFRVGIDSFIFYLSSPTRKAISVDRANPTYIFFPKESDNELQLPIEQTLLVNEDKSFYYLSRHDSIPAFMINLEQRGMVKIRDNVFIPGALPNTNTDLRLSLNCPKSETDEAELEDIVQGFGLASPLYAFIMIHAPGKMVEIIGKVSSLSIIDDKNSGEKKIIAYLNHSLIPLLDYPHYGQLELSVPLSGGEHSVKATIPAYHAEPRIHPQDILKMHKTSIQFKAQIKFLKTTK